MRRNLIATVVMVLVVNMLCVSWAHAAANSCNGKDADICCVVDQADATGSGNTLAGAVDRYNRTGGNRRCAEEIYFAVGQTPVEIVTEIQQSNGHTQPNTLTFTNRTTDDGLTIGGFDEDDVVQFDVTGDQPIFKIQEGVDSVNIQNITVDGKGTAPFIVIDGSKVVHITNVTLKNMPANAIQISGADQVTISGLVVEGNTEGAAVISVLDSTSFSVTGSTLGVGNTIVGNGITIDGTTNFSISNVTINMSDTNITGTGIVIEDSHGYTTEYSIGGGTAINNVKHMGIAFLDIDNSVNNSESNNNGLIKFTEFSVNGSGGTVGMYLSNTNNLSFTNFTISGFTTGVQVLDSNSNTFSSDSVVISGIDDVETNGIVFEGTSDANSVVQANLNNHPLGCGVVLNTEGKTKLDQLQLYNTDECGVGVEGTVVELFSVTDTDPAVALFKLSQNKVLFDVLQTTIGSSPVKYVELHRLMKTDAAMSWSEAADEVSLIGSVYEISDLSDSSLPSTPAPEGGNDYYFMALLKNSEGNVLGVWRGEAGTEVPSAETCYIDSETGAEVCLAGCYHDDVTGLSYRPYDMVVDYDDDGLTDGWEDCATYTYDDKTYIVTAECNYTETSDMDCSDNGQSESNVYNPDSDEDGIPDGIEWQEGLKYDPTDSDTDDDGLSDYEEDPDMDGCSSTATDEDGDGRSDCYHSITLADGTKIMETNPLNPDSDGDGVDDGLERHRGTNPWAIDSDGDGEKDDTDKCPMQSDRTDGCYVGGAKTIDVFCVPISLRYENVMNDISEGEISGDTYDCGDADNDDLCLSVEDKDGDCEYDPGIETDASSDDTDNDKISDNKEDRNTDGIYYPEDTTEISSPILTDSDGDCIMDGLEDENFDGIINLDSGETYPNLLDSDKDGKGDGEEDNNPLNSDQSCNGTVDLGELNPSKDDSEGDGLLDGVDPAPFSSDIGAEYYYYKSGVDVDTDGDNLILSKEDTNGNGRPDVAEGECNANYADTDGDGLADNHELQYKTNCNSPHTDADDESDTEELVPGWTCVIMTDEHGREVCTPPTDEQVNLYLSNAEGKPNAQLGQTNPRYFSKGCSLNTLAYQATFGSGMPIIGLMGLALASLLRFRRKES